MKDELKGFTPEELEQAAQEARAARAQYWDERFADESDDLADLKPAKVKVAKKLGARATVGLRLAAEELALIEQSAHERGVTFSEFVRDAALAAASSAISLESQAQARLITDMRISLSAFEAALRRLEANAGAHAVVGRASTNERKIGRASSKVTRAAAVAGRVLATRAQKTGKVRAANARTQRPKATGRTQAKGQKPKGGTRDSR